MCPIGLDPLKREPVRGRVDPSQQPSPHHRLSPEPQNSHVGNVSDEIKSKIGKERARTIPARPEGLPAHTRSQG